MVHQLQQPQHRKDNARRCDYLIPGAFEKYQVAGGGEHFNWAISGQTLGKFVYPWDPNSPNPPAPPDLCEKAIALQPYEGSHWANLVRLYVGVKNRKKAVEVLETGLKKHPKDGKLLRVREEIGYRQAPSLIFLPRAHPLNKFFSRTASAWTKNGRTILYVAAGLLVAGIAASVIYLLMQ